MNIAIIIKNLHKSYGSLTVLKGINFDVKKGEIFALLGVNGAGKTTALECIEGLRRYDCGNITVNGKMGIQLQSSSLPEHIKSMEAIQLFAKWNNTKTDQSMLTAFGINELAKKQYSQLSTGQKRRLHLALALISKPDIVFLDEPTAGLDVEGRISLHEQIRKLKAHECFFIWRSIAMEIGYQEQNPACYLLHSATLIFCPYGRHFCASINLEMKSTLIQSMTVMGVSIGALIGLPSSLVGNNSSDVKKAYKANGIPLYLSLVSMFLSTFFHLMIMSVIIFLILFSSRKMK